MKLAMSSFFVILSKGVAPRRGLQAAPAARGREHAGALGNSPLRPSRPKPARLTTRSECTCDARSRIAYTSDA